MFFSFWLTSLYNRLYVHPPHWNWFKCIPFYGCVIYSIVHMYHSFFILSSVDGHIGCFHVLAIINNSGINIGVHVSFSVLVSSGYMLHCGTVGSYGSFISSFEKTLRWEESSRGKGYLYIYGWFMLMYGRNQHDIVKKLSFI